MVVHKKEEPKTEFLQNLKELLLAKEEILFVFVYGSFLDSELLAHDVDVAVYIDADRIQDRDFFDYRMRISIDLTKETGREIDLRILNGAPLGFKHSVFKYGRLLFSKDEELMFEVIEKTALEYIDFYELSLDYLRDAIP
jgi:predicted nucleotidyltransferase